jgi:hypothetical protein
MLRRRGPGSAEPGSPLAICHAAVQALEMTGAGISVMTTAGHRGTVCATDSVAAVIEELQFTLGDGPCVDAFHHGPVMIDDLDDYDHVVRSAWPQFTQQASAAGARALLALPLQIGAIRVGALDVYRGRPGPLSDAQLGLALTLADAAAGSLLADRHGQAIDTPLDPTEPGASYHAEVHQATGMLSVQLGIALDDAFVRLRAYAFANERPVNDISHDVVDGRLRFDDEDGGQQ